MPYSRHSPNVIKLAIGSKVDKPNNAAPIVYDISVKIVYRTPSDWIFVDLDVDTSNLAVNADMLNLVLDFISKPSMPHFRTC